MASFKDKAAAVAADNIVNGEDVEASIANRPHEQAFTNTDHLASVLNADRNTVITGGGTITWDAGTETLTFGGTIYIGTPNENISTGVGGAVNHVIVAGSLDFGAGGTKTIAALKMSRTSEPTYTMGDVDLFTDMSALEAQISGESDDVSRFDYIILAVREAQSLPPNPNDHIILWDGRRVRDGESITNSGATDSQYAQESDYQALRLRDNQDRNTFLLGGGILTWEGTTYGLKCTQSFYINMPENVLMEISAATLPAIDNDECYIINIGGIPALDRTDDNTTVVSVVARTLTHADLDEDDDDLLVLAVCKGSRLHLMDGTVIEAGFRGKLGGLAQGVKWIYSGPGTGLASYDFSAVGGSTIQPPGATPEFYPGGAELMVFVNGVRYLEGRYTHPSGATNADYDEPADTTNPYTSITWTPSGRPIPGPSDWVVAFVGLATPNMGPLGIDQLKLAQSDGTVIESLDFSSEDLREDDSTNPTVSFASIGTGAEVSVGGVIADPVSGRRAGAGGVIHGALLAYAQRPQLFRDHADSTGTGGSVFGWLSPGELPLPLTSSRDTWIVHRAWSPLSLDFRSGAGAVSSSGNMVYVYIDGSGTSHDTSLTSGMIKYSSTPPDTAVDTDARWMAHPTNLHWVYVGCAFVHAIGGVPTHLAYFDRSGDSVLYGAGDQVNVLNDSTGWGAAGGQIGPVSLSDRVPRVAHSAILQVQFDVDMTAYTGAGGTDITGVAFYNDQSNALGVIPGTFPSDMGDAHDVQYLVQPNSDGASSPSATKRYAYAPFTLPVNDLGAGDTADPTFHVWVGPYLDSIKVNVVGFVENQQHVYRHSP